MSVSKEIRNIHRRHHISKLNDGTTEYRQFLAEYLLELALMLGWYQSKKRSRRNEIPNIFEDLEFLAITGIPFVADDYLGASHRRRNNSDENDTDILGRNQPVYFQKLLCDRLEEIKSELKHVNMPLFNNIRMLSDLLGLTKADNEVLLFASAINLFPKFRNVIASQNVHTSNFLLNQILSRLSNLPENETASAISDRSILMITGIVKIGRGVSDLEDKLDLINGLATVLLTPHSSTDELVNKFLKKTAPPTLSLTNFPHLKNDTNVVLPYLKNSLNTKTEGVNILLHGKPGVGKTEYVFALAKEMGIDLYEIAYSDEDGDPIKGEARLRAYSLCQNIMSKSSNSCRSL